MIFKPGDIVQIKAESYFIFQNDDVFVWQENEDKTLDVKLLKGSHFYGIYIKLHEFATRKNDAEDWHDVLINNQLYIVSTKQIILVNEQNLYNK